MSIEATHTPGPWQVHHHGHACGEQWLSVLHGAWDITHNYASKPGVVADAAHSAMSDATNLANAHLIAAAPDMLAALQAVNKLISEAAMTGFNCKDGDWADRLFHSQQATSAAIKKATKSAQPTTAISSNQDGTGGAA